MVGFYVQRQDVPMYSNIFIYGAHEGFSLPKLHNYRNGLRAS